jgi:hypothetical protein
MSIMLYLHYNYSYALNNPLRFVDPSGYYNKPSPYEREQAREGYSYYNPYFSITNPRLAGNYHTNYTPGSGFTGSIVTGTSFDWKTGNSQNIYMDVPTGRQYIKQMTGSFVVDDGTDFWVYAIFGSDVYMDGPEEYFDLENYGYDRDGRERLSDASGVYLSASIGESARLSLITINQGDYALKTIKGISTGARWLGYAGIGLNLYINYNMYANNPTWGNFARAGISTTSAGLSIFYPGPGTLAGLGLSVIDAAGGFNGFYETLDFNETLYKSSGSLMIPSPFMGSYIPTIINLK